MAKKITYSEPLDFFPKSIRKSAKIGEYSGAKSGSKATPKKKTVKRGK